MANLNITRFEPGKPLAEQLTASRMNMLVDALDHLRVRSGRGYDVVYQGPGGTTLDITAGRGGTPALIPPFSLVKASTPTQARIQLTSSSINGWIPSVFAPGDDPKYYINVTENGYVWAWVAFDENGGIYTGDGGRGVDFGSTVPDDEDLIRYVPIGSYEFVAASPPGGPTARVSNVRYGPISAVICRDWFSNPATFGITWE
jgi:hypothetical protein